MVGLRRPSRHVHPDAPVPRPVQRPVPIGRLASLYALSSISIHDRIPIDRNPNSLKLVVASLHRTPAPLGLAAACCFCRHAVPTPIEPRRRPPTPSRGCAPRLPPPRAHSSHRTSSTPAWSTSRTSSAAQGTTTTTSSRRSSTRTSLAGTSTSPCGSF